MTKPVYVPLSVAAARTNRNHEWLRRLCAAGEIPAIKQGRNWFVTEPVVALIGALPRRAR